MISIGPHIYLATLLPTSNMIYSAKKKTSNMITLLVKKIIKYTIDKSIQNIKTNQNSPHHIKNINGK